MGFRVWGLGLRLATSTRLGVDLGSGLAVVFFFKRADRVGSLNLNHTAGA